LNFTGEKTQQKYQILEHVAKNMTWGSRTNLTWECPSPATQLVLFVSWQLC